jgi:hypothetical protein
MQNFTNFQDEVKIDCLGMPQLTQWHCRTTKGGWSGVLGVKAERRARCAGLVAASASGRVDNAEEFGGKMSSCSKRKGKEKRILCLKNTD